MKFIRQIKEIGAMTKRCMMYTLRNVDNLLTMLFLPIAVLLLFVFVFGGAIQTGNDNYIDYVIFGILLINIGYGAGTTAVSLNVDLQNGIIDRFRTMPIGRNVVLTGHVLASIIKNIISTVVLFGLAFLIGFRSIAGFGGWFAAVCILLLYSLAMTWLAIVFGLIAKTPEGASAFSYVFLFFPYISSAFVPTKTMPKALRLLAENQPVTPINESVRTLLMDLPVGNNVFLSLIWCFGITAVTYSISRWIYDRKS